MNPLKHCDLTLSTPEENLAADEVLLDLCEAGSGASEGLLRFWEPAQYFVVVGYGNHVSREVNLEFCREHNIAVLRRCSGGGTVLQGPGCLNYSLILPVQPGSMESIPATNRFIMRRHQEAFTALLQARVETKGYTDLAIGGLKFCGNAQRRRRLYVLFHGCFLLHADIGLIEKALRLPSRQPAYRANRSHTDFLVNLRLPAQIIKAALAKVWGATELMPTLPLDEITQLAREKYAHPEWNTKF
jgi:lipoate---protein ligase